MTAPRLRTILFLQCAALLTWGAAGCSHRGPAGAPAAGEGETFRGVYEAGTNRSVFLPCGSEEQWYVWAGSTSARELRRLTVAQDVQSPGGGMVPPENAPDTRRAYAEVRGDTVGVTSKQPAPPYERELRLTQVLLVKPTQGRLCQ